MGLEPPEALGCLEHGGPAQGATRYCDLCRRANLRPRRAKGLAADPPKLKGEHNKKQWEKLKGPSTLMRDVRLLPEQVAKQSLQTIGIGPGRGGLPLFCRIVDRRAGLRSAGRPDARPRDKEPTPFRPYRYLPPPFEQLVGVHVRGVGGGVILPRSAV